MPLLDVSDVLSDPLFADAANVTRSVVDVDPQTGRSVKTETTTAISVVVTSDKGRNLQRNPEAALSTGSIIMHSVFRFTEGGAGLDADVVTWNGRRYTVVTVDDYSRYGAGFTCATCRLLDLR
ncbi:conserved hypothetical protein [Bosea sp. 62]|uniref:hypothetical protein n=1 Tax=unclassified Bosea (in: a-proteobacteria) TaxID=2653178 RepID=UPI001258994E|nr:MULTISPECIES: hypothetical protein [unclassified Bosea (in: a-proteobacteria)]CAD5254363.1 conserved hypothetical protein [Bosea sp. 7B]CAD5276683.1 conserved hypothetical protein [Bosea sp. 21B]CAD5277835.1 conserved hypothetical protein [Bosea sp. 46]VVT59853.1 conserved hypothetical protein [Bosea sp. EC-HK365B]VXB46225.1 conserved hypothetical protein [Bosea sp. 62]